MKLLGNINKFAPGYNLRITEDGQIDRIDPDKSYCLWDAEILASFGYGFLLSHYLEKVLMIDLLYLPLHYRNKRLASRALIRIINFATETTIFNEIKLEVQPFIVSSNYANIDILPINSEEQSRTEEFYKKHAFAITEKIHVKTGEPVRIGSKLLRKS